MSQIREALLIGLGLAAGGAMAGTGLARARVADRYVSVKGISERDARADLAIWPLRIVASDNDLAQANVRLEASARTVRQFLARHGLDSASASADVQDFSVTDAYLTVEEGRRPPTRYIIREAIVVRSTKPDLVLAASQRVAELVSAGVVLSSGEGGGGGPTFIFSGLNGLKPAMIAEATARAREAAEQFAHDSHSEIGGIRQAYQGVFEILPRDQAPGISEESQVAKTVRVVSTIDYLLKN
jgi:hypothetical protein